MISFWWILKFFLNSSKHNVIYVFSDFWTKPKVLFSLRENKLLQNSVKQQWLMIFSHLNFCIYVITKCLHFNWKIHNSWFQARFFSVSSKRYHNIYLVQVIFPTPKSWELWYQEGLVPLCVLITTFPEHILGSVLRTLSLGTISLPSWGTNWWRAPRLWWKNTSFEDTA